MNEIFLGWDVGAWNCDRNRESRDALCALRMGASGPELHGTPWRGNLRDVLVRHEGDGLIDALLGCVGVVRNEARVTIAIDTPLAWPRKMLELVTAGSTCDVPAEADKNPYLFRRQELTLFECGRRPLSVVRDMIGSQSTKGGHFLRRAQLAPASLGVWGLGRVTAIETYPAVALATAEFANQTAQVLTGLLKRETQNRSEAWRTDVRDAIACGLVAMLHRRQPQRLEAPSAEADSAEGWIWLPTRFKAAP